MLPVQLTRSGMSWLFEQPTLSKERDWFRLGFLESFLSLVLSRSGLSFQAAGFFLFFTQNVSEGLGVLISVARALRGCLDAQGWSVCLEVARSNLIGLRLLLFIGGGIGRSHGAICLGGALLCK